MDMQKTKEAERICEEMLRGEMFEKETVTAPQVTSEQDRAEMEALELKFKEQLHHLEEEVRRLRSEAGGRQVEVQCLRQEVMDLTPQTICCKRHCSTM